MSYYYRYFLPSYHRHLWVTCWFHSKLCSFTTQSIIIQALTSTSRKSRNLLKNPHSSMIFFLNYSRFTCFCFFPPCFLCEVEQSGDSATLIVSLSTLGETQLVPGLARNFVCLDLLCAIYFSSINLGLAWLYCYDGHFAVSQNKQDC